MLSICAPASIEIAPISMSFMQIRPNLHVCRRKSRSICRRPEAECNAVTQSFPSCRTLRFSALAVIHRRSTEIRRCWLSASMNSIVRSALRATALRNMLSSSCGNNGGSQSVRTLWNVCGRRHPTEIVPRFLVSSLELHDFRVHRCYSKSHTKGIDPPTRVLCSHELHVKRLHSRHRSQPYSEKVLPGHGNVFGFNYETWNWNCSSFLSLSFLENDSLAVFFLQLSLTIVRLM